MPAHQTQTQWKTILEMHRPYLDLSLKMAEIEGKRYLMIFVDDFSDWKEFAIYTLSADEGKVKEIAGKIEEIVEKAENDECYDPVPEIASTISEIVDTFIVGEIPEEMGLCSDDEYIAFPDEDERLNWPLCLSRTFAKYHLLLLKRYNLLPNEWTPHIQEQFARVCSDNSFASSENHARSFP